MFKSESRIQHILQIRLLLDKSHHLADTKLSFLSIQNWYSHDLKMCDLVTNIIARHLYEFSNHQNN